MGLGWFTDLGRFHIAGAGIIMVSLPGVEEIERDWASGRWRGIEKVR
jgi:hypothetical protein